MVLPNTGIEGSLKIAEEIRKEVISLNIEHSVSQVAGVVTLSLGAATLEDNNNLLTDKEFLDLADKALYKAKESGKNVCVHSSLSR